MKKVLRCDMHDRKAGQRVVVESLQCGWAPWLCLSAGKRSVYNSVECVVTSGRGVLKETL